MLAFLQQILMRAHKWHSVLSYEVLLSRRLREHPENRDLGYAKAIGAQSLEDFERQGDGHVAVLRHHGLRDGAAIYDLGCGSGRTALALRRSGWQGSYTGADIVRRLVDYLKEKCPEYEAIVHRELSLAAKDASLDIVFHWSVFTHLYPEECYLYMRDCLRALKPGGKLIFSFLELEDPAHHKVFHPRIGHFAKNGWLPELDVFIHRDWIRFWARDLGFAAPNFTDGADAANHPPFWQSLAVMTKPERQDGIALS